LGLIIYFLLELSRDIVYMICRRKTQSLLIKEDIKGCFSTKMKKFQDVQIIHHIIKWLFKWSQIIYCVSWKREHERNRNQNKFYHIYATTFIKKVRKNNTKIEQFFYYIIYKNCIIQTNERTFLRREIPKLFD